MDIWQKIEVLSKIIAAIFIPLAVAYLANQVATSNKQRDSETKFVELATAILNTEPASNQSIDSKNLRSWAVDVVNKFSGVPMPKATAEALITTTALPIVKNASEVSADPQGTWGVIFGGDSTLEEAQFEVTKTAAKMGLGTGVIFRREGSFRSVKIYNLRSDAEDAVEKAKTVRSTSYIVNMGQWCPMSTERQGYFECINAQL